MKILFINKYLYQKGGSETYVIKLGDYLAKQGHEVQYFGMDDEKRIVGNNVGLYIKQMDFHDTKKFARFINPIKTIYSLESRRKLQSILNDFEPDVVHLNNFNYQITPSVILEIVSWRTQHNKSIRIIYTAHDYNLICPNHLLYNPNNHQTCEMCLGGYFYWCTKRKCIHNSILKSIIGSFEGYYWKLRETYKYIDCIICCSSFMKSRLDTNPLFLKKTILLQNFINIKKENDYKKKNYVLYFGRLSEEKGIMTLINACIDLPNINFVFAGTGPLSERTRGVPNIESVGFVDGKELERLISEALFSVCPSECYDNCPFSVMESQALGTPVLGANIGGIPELIQSGQTGDLFIPGDIGDLKKRILDLWNDRNRIEKYSYNCKDVCFLDINQYYSKLIKLYEITN